MGLANIKQELGQGGMKERPEKMPPPPPPKEEKKDTSGFGGKPYLDRAGVREWLRRNPEAYKITGLTEKERVELEKKWFGPEYGHYIKKDETEDVLRKLELERGRAKTQKEQTEKEREIRVLKKFLGK